MQGIDILLRISLVAWEEHEIDPTHCFSGEGRALGGFHRARSHLAIGAKPRLCAYG